MYSSTGASVTRFAAKKPLRTLSAVDFTLARPFWYSIARSNAATIMPTANRVQPRQANSRTEATIQLKSNISAPMPPICVNTSEMVP